MRVLAIDETAHVKVAGVLDYALDRKHWYRPAKDARVPGDDPRFVTHLDTYRCVFTITETPAGPMRHLSISVPAKELYPNVIAAFTIAEMFGFTGWDGKTPMPPPSWAGRVDRDDHCIVLAQAYEVPA